MATLEEEPKTKKAKIEIKDEGEDEEDEHNDEEVVVKRNETGEAYFELSPSKRLTVRTFKGRVLIDVREFYGEAPMKPGKKGISLTVDQFHDLSKCITSGQVQQEIAKLQEE